MNITDNFCANITLPFAFTLPLAKSYKRKKIRIYNKFKLLIHTAGALALPEAKSTKSLSPTVIVTWAATPSWGLPS